MKKAILPSTENSINSVLEHFFHINRKRLDFTRQFLTTPQADFIDLLPMLFHCNHPQFPGYVSQSTPCGIAQYSPMQQSLRAAKKLFKSFEHKRRAHFKMEISSMFFMGSSGSIAYSSKSDFDVWLIHEKDIEPERVQELQQKAELIEQWAEDLKLEVHFFIFDSETFKNGTLSSLSSESSGSSQHRLLLDEFYRSSLLIAGRYPVWWLVPPDQEEHYESYVADLLNKRFISSNDIVDFGPVSPVPSDEFFGAAIWQLYKGINSPYKSVIKLLLMETYASEHPNIELLSTRYKELIYQREEELSMLDPYIIMYRKIANYLMIQQDKKRLDTFRESFYLKINERLSQKSRVASQCPRRKIFAELMLEWGWDEHQYRTLDNNKEWHIDNIKEQRSKLTHVLTKSYQFLSDFGRKNADVYRISQSELNVLGRKLYAAFDRKTGKIEIINRGIAPKPSESQVSIIQNKNKQGQNQWLLYRERKPLDAISETPPLHRSADLLPLLLWCHLNQIVTRETYLFLNTLDDVVSLNEIQKTLQVLDHLFPNGNRPEATFADLSSPASITKASIFINLGGDKHVSENRNELITSDRTDPLSYGAVHRNLIESFDLIITSSWEEIFVYRYYGIEGMLQMITEMSHWSSDKNRLAACEFQCFCHSQSHSENISQRIKVLLREMIQQTILDHQQHKIRRYLLSAEDRYYVLENHYGKINHHDNLNLHQLSTLLQKPNLSFAQLTYDRSSEWTHVLPYLYSLNQESAIQLFFKMNKDMIDIFILDERGSLHHQKMDVYKKEILFNHFEQFLQSVDNRMSFITGDFSLEDKKSRQYFEIQHNKKGAPSISQYTWEYASNADGYIDIKVIGAMSDDDQNHLSIYCNDKEFSSLEYGDHVFREVTEHVISLRESHQDYPIYITDIDFSSGIFNILEPEEIQTIHFLNYKKKIEDKLNRSLDVMAQNGLSDTQG